MDEVEGDHGRFELRRKRIGGRWPSELNTLGKNSRDQKQFNVTVVINEVEANYIRIPTKDIPTGIEFCQNKVTSQDEVYAPIT